MLQPIFLLIILSACFFIGFAIGRAQAWLIGGFVVVAMVVFFFWLAAAIKVDGNKPRLIGTYPVTSAPSGVEIPVL